MDFASVRDSFFRIFSLVFSGLIFIYLLSFLVIRPVNDYNSPPKQESSDYYEYQKAEIGSEELSVSEKSEGTEENYKAEPTDINIVWKPGLISELLIINDTLSILNDDLLESDSKPEILFNHIERAYIVRFLMITVVSVWSVLLLLTIAAIYKRHWFHRTMAVFVYIPLFLSFIAVLLTFRRNEIFDYGYSFLMTSTVLIEGFFIMGSAAVIYRSVIPLSAQERSQMIPFMEHLYTIRASLTGSSWSGLSMSFQITVLALISLIISNIILLPLYTIQQSFPALYTSLLILGLIALAFFYVLAYARVSRESEAEKSGLQYISGLAFLGYRFLRNFFMIIMSVGFIGLIISLIIITALLNIDFLQSVHLLQTNESF